MLLIEERERLVVTSYVTITSHTPKQNEYNLINNTLHDTTHKLLPTMKIVTYSSNICIVLL
jgi:hypothetical protein